MCVADMSISYIHSFIMLYNITSHVFIIHYVFRHYCHICTYYVHVYIAAMYEYCLHVFMTIFRAFKLARVPSNIPNNIFYPLLRFFYQVSTTCAYNGMSCVDTVTVLAITPGSLTKPARTTAMITWCCLFARVVSGLTQYA